MKALVVIAVLTAACGGGSSQQSECDAIRSDPPQALAKVASHADDQVKMWQILETCFVPQGDECERAAVGAAMAPRMIGDGSNMTPTEAGIRQETRRQWVLSCRKLPADQQRCLQVSYSLGHAECNSLVQRARANLR